MDACKTMRRELALSICREKSMIALLTEQLLKRLQQRQRFSPSKPSQLHLCFYFHHGVYARWSSATCHKVKDSGVRELTQQIIQRRTLCDFASIYADDKTGCINVVRIWLNSYGDRCSRGRLFAFHRLMKSGFFQCIVQPSFSIHGLLNRCGPKKNRSTKNSCVTSSMQRSHQVRRSSGL